MAEQQNNPLAASTPAEAPATAAADKVATESAKRAQNRIHSDESNILGSTVFTK